MSASRRPPAFGWIPDYPDFRDYTSATASIREILSGAPSSDGTPRRPYF